MFKLPSLACKVGKRGGLEKYSQDMKIWFIFYFRVSVEIARGTPHGRDREKWGGGRGGGRDDRRGGGSRDDRRGGRDGGRDRPVWLDKYGPPTRTDFRVVVENLSSRVSWQVYIIFISIIAHVSPF